MSVQPNTRYRTVYYALANGSKTDVYTAGAGSYADIISVNVCASTGTAGGTITLAAYDVSATTEYVLAYQADVPGTDSLEIPFYPLHMEPGDILRATGAANMHLAITMIEVGRGA